jgi:TRAP-type mannitol/chloroaromatic compound transport system permease small subunit
MDRKPTTQQNLEDQPSNLLDKCIYVTGNVLSLFFVFTVAISFYEVVMRYAFNSPTTWVHETASFIGGSLFVIGGAYALAINKHVRVVILYDMVSQRARHYLNVFHHICGLLFSGMLIFAGYSMVKNSWFNPWGELQLETSGTSWNPAYPALLKGIILLTVIIMFVQFTLHLIQEIKAIKELNDV